MPPKAKAPPPVVRLTHAQRLRQERIAQESAARQARDAHRDAPYDRAPMEKPGGQELYHYHDRAVATAVAAGGGVAGGGAAAAAGDGCGHPAWRDTGAGASGPCGHQRLVCQGCGKLLLEAFLSHYDDVDNHTHVYDREWFERRRRGWAASAPKVCSEAELED